MAPPPWTTPAQRVFLWTHVVAFREAQEEKRTDDYLAEVYEEWFLKYPQVDQTQVSKDKKRVYDWLRNRATPSRYKGLGELAHQARCTIVQLLLNTVPPKKRRKAQPAHAFSNLYFDKGLGDKLETAYQAMLNDPEITTKLKQIDFYGKETRRLYEEASEEVKKEVEAYRSKVAAEDLGDELERFLYEDEVDLDDAEKGRLAEGRQTQMAIDVLEPLLYEISKTIEEVIGWRSHFVVGGPEPFRDGKITSIAVGSGKSADEDTSFMSFYPEYKKNIEDPFSAYLKKNYRPEQRAVFANIPFKNWVPAMRSSNGRAESLRKKKGTSRKRKSSTPTETTHEEDNRPRKRTQQVPSDETGRMAQPVASTRYSTEPAQDIGPPTPTPAAAPTASGDSTSLMSNNPEEVRRLTEVEVEVDPSLPLSLQVVAKRVDHNGAESFKLANTGSWVTQYEMARLKQIERNRQLLVETMPVSASQILPMRPTKKKSATRQRHNRVKTTVPEKRTLPQRQTRSLALTKGATHAPSANSAPQVDSHGSQSSSRPALDPLRSIDILIPRASQSLDNISFDDIYDSEPTGPNLNAESATFESASTETPLPHTADGESNAHYSSSSRDSPLPSLTSVLDGVSSAHLVERSTPSAIGRSADGILPSEVNDFPNFELSALPSWLSGPISHLMANFNGQKEMLVIRGLVALEQKWGWIDRKLDTKGRPEAVSWWLSRGRPLDKYKTPLDLPSYGKSMRDWWTAHQPSCRLDGRFSWPLKQDIPANESWNGMRKGGKNGLLVFVMGLYWWKLEAQNQGSATALSEFYTAVDDALYVFQHMILSNQQPLLFDTFSTSGRTTKQTVAVQSKDGKSLRSSALPADPANKENMRATRSRTAKH